MSERILIYLAYTVIFVVLFCVELLYLRIAKRCNIVDVPNGRSSHNSVVLRGGGIVFVVSVFTWVIWQLVNGNKSTICDKIPFLLGLVIVSVISFLDDVKSMPISVRLVCHFTAICLLLFGAFKGYEEELSLLPFLIAVALFLVISIGALNIYNFMDGINGITAAYSLSVLIPLLLADTKYDFIDASFILVVILSVIVFAFFNFRKKGKAICFSGDIGSIGMAFIVLYIISRLIAATNDPAWLAFLVVYGVDGCLTICHRIMLHEKLSLPHRKHLYQLLSNELGMPQLLVSCIYALLQFSISIMMLYIIPDTILAHLIFLAVALLVLGLVYVITIKKRTDIQDM